MKRNIFNTSGILLILLTVILFGKIDLFAQDVNDIIENVQDTYDDMDNLSAHFLQRQTFKLSETLTETKGKIYIKNGKKYRFESEDQVIVTDGKDVWTYNAISQQLLIDHVRENSGAFLPRDLLFKYPKTHYATLLKTEPGKAHKQFLIRLDPKEDSQGFLKNIKIWVEDETWLINKIETTDLSGNSSLFIITNMDYHTKISDTLFQFKAPEGADVVDMRQ